MKRKTFIIILLVVIAILVGIYFIQVPCGGATLDDTGRIDKLWSGSCSYGPLLIENLKNGKFFLPF